MPNTKPKLPTTMSYNTEITFHQGSSREWTYEDSFATLQEAVDHINHQAAGNMCRAWINNREVRIRSCLVVGNDGEPFCTNAAWHDTFAPAAYPRIERAA